MGIEEEAARAAAAAEAAEAEFNNYDEGMEPERPALSFDFSWLKTPTGPGSIEDYLKHPLNAHESRGIAQILRGSTGFFGALDLALIDITIGALEVIKERREAAAAPAAAQGGGYNVDR